MSNATAPSIQKISDNFLEEQARASGGTIEVEVKEVIPCPFEHNYWILIKCGVPFNGKLLRIPLGDTKVDAFETLTEIYDSPIDDFFSLDLDSLDISFDVHHSVLDIGIRISELEFQHIEHKETENPVIANGLQAVICDAPIAAEHNLLSDDEKRMFVREEFIQQVRMYYATKSISRTEEHTYIEKVDPISERQLELLVNVGVEEPLTVSVTLPRPDEVNSHPVSEFVNKVASGKIRNLEQRTVFIGPSDSAETIGEDTTFNTFGLSATPCVAKDNTRLSEKLFGLL